jgi:hypothetical protein
MKTKIWENEELFKIEKELQKMIENKIIKTVISMSFTNCNQGTVHYNYSAILIYK